MKTQTMIRGLLLIGLGGLVAGEVQKMVEYLGGLINKLKAEVCRKGDARTGQT